jgi:hypothetical protein
MRNHAKKDSIALLIIIGINILFSIKYGSRLTASPVLVAGMIVANFLPVALYIISVYSKVAFINNVFQSTFTTWLLPFAFITLSTISFFAVHQTGLHVDRHEMIRLFWDNAFSGHCPYCPRSAGTNIPGPFPFYFFAALPFYLIGEFGFFSLFGILLFTGALMFDKTLSIKSRNLLLMLLVLSPAVWWEMACRSTIFLNSAMLLAGMVVFDKKYSDRLAQTVWFGLLFGLLLSTRSIAFLFIAQVVVYKLKFRLFSVNGLVLATCAAIAFTGTFIPVIALCKGTFLTYNPFIVQSSLAPPVFYGAIALFSLWVVSRCADFYTFCIVSGVVCFLIVAGYFIKTCFEVGLTTAYFGSIMDISYALLALPFLLYGLGRSETENA